MNHKLPRLLVVSLLNTGLGFYYANGQTEKNLIQNPDGELPLINKQIPHWTAIQGNRWGLRSRDPLPQNGKSYFFAWAVPEAELVQVVDVANYADQIARNGVQFRFSGYVRSWPQRPSDSSQIIIELLDSNDRVLASYDLGSYDQYSEWKLLTKRLAPPPQTRKIKIRLLSHRKNGSNNDGYFDNLSLVPELSKQQPQQESATSQSAVSGQFPDKQSVAPKPETEPILNEPVTLKNVLFKLSTATLLPESFPELDRLASLLQTKPALKVRLEGHTDRIGDASRNLKLSQDRVSEVKRYLIQKGINATRITVKGYGDTKTICSSPCEANRRVELVITDH